GTIPTDLRVVRSTYYATKIGRRHRFRGFLNGRHRIVQTRCSSTGFIKSEAFDLSAARARFGEPVPCSSMFGSHLSIAGSMVHALDEARRLKMDCVQVFTKNQRQWRVSPLKPEDIAAWHAAVRKLGWLAAPGAPSRIVSHNSYL